jgi:His-Xaa-Ser system protein HxsD
MYKKNEIIDGEVIVYADSKLYSKDSLFKCMYWYGGKFHTNISMYDKSTYRISIKPVNDIEYNSEKLKQLLFQLERDLIDFNLRDIVTKETQNLRDLLVAKAFSNGEFDENPPGEISDPIGFIP